jgi:crossover junction endodeoxyribonuclease RuvC
VIILGIDPGTRVTGYGLIDLIQTKEKIVDYGCIRPCPKMKLTDRYHVLYNGVAELILNHRPEALVVETQYIGANPQSALKLGMARGAIIIAAKQQGIPIFEYTPSKAKSAVVGNGKASKFQVQGMVKLLLGLSTIPEPEDAADALALALCHARMCQHVLIPPCEI